MASLQGWPPGREDKALGVASTALGWWNEIDKVETPVVAAGRKENLMPNPLPNAALRVQGSSGPLFDVDVEHLAVRVEVRQTNIT